MRDVAGSSKIVYMGSAGNDNDRPVDKTLGKSPAFKAVSRSDVNNMNALYEQDFANDFNRYNIKYNDKIKGRANFAPPSVQPRDAQPHQHCTRGLTKLA